MRKLFLALVLLAPLTGALAGGLKPDLKVTLQVQDQPLTTVADTLAAQLGVQISVVAPDDTKVTLDLKDVAPEAALKALAEAGEASWMRAYLLEKQPPDPALSAEELLGLLQKQRQDWFESMSTEQREALFRGWQETRPGPGQPELPGAGIAVRKVQPGGGNPMGPGMGRRFDPVRMLISSGRRETVTLNWQARPLAQACFDFAAASGFLLVAGDDLTGELTLAAEQQPVDQVLDQIAAALGAQWRPVYLLSRPRELSEAEQDKLMDQAFTSMASRFWAMPPEQRSQRVQEAVKAINGWAAAAREPAAEGQVNRAAEALRTYGPKILARAQTYVSALSPQQRAEIKPVMKALTAAVNAPAQP